MTNKSIKAPPLSVIFYILGQLVVYHYSNVNHILLAKHTFDYSEILNHNILISACEPPTSDLVEFVLQHAGVQAQLAEAVLLHRLNDAVHLCVVLRGQVGEVDVRRDELSAQHTCA